MFWRGVIYVLHRELKRLLLKTAYANQLKIGKKVGFRKNVKFYFEKDAQVVIGDRCFFNNDCSINVQNELLIGDDTLFGEGVRIYDHNHVFSSIDVPIALQGFKSAPISIGSNCWICSNVIILKGAKIGNNCVIGAGCIISEAIPDNTIVKCVQQKITEIHRNTGGN